MSEESTKDPKALFMEVVDHFSTTASDLKIAEGVCVQVAFLLKYAEEHNKFMTASVPAAIVDEVPQEMRTLFTVIFDCDDDKIENRIWEDVLRRMCADKNPDAIILIREAWATYLQAPEGVDAMEYAAAVVESDIDIAHGRQDSIIIYYESVWGNGMRVLAVSKDADGKTVVTNKTGPVTPTDDRLEGHATGFLPCNRDRGCGCGHDCAPDGELVS